MRFVNEWLTVAEGDSDPALATRAAALREWMVSLLAAEHFGESAPRRADQTRQKESRATVSR